MRKAILACVLSGAAIGHAFGAAPPAAITVSVVDGGKLKDVRVALLEEGGTAELHSAQASEGPVDPPAVETAGAPSPRAEWALFFKGANYDAGGNATLAASLYERDPDHVSALREMSVVFPAGQHVATIHGAYGIDYLLSIHRCTEKGCA